MGALCASATKSSDGLQYEGAGKRDQQHYPCGLMIPAHPAADGGKVAPAGEANATPDPGPDAGGDPVIDEKAAERHARAPAAAEKCRAGTGREAGQEQHLGTVPGEMALDTLTALAAPPAREPGAKAPADPVQDRIAGHEAAQAGRDQQRQRMLAPPRA